VCCPHRKKQGLVQELLQPEASFPRPTFLAADLSTTPLDTVLLNSASSVSSTTTTTNNTVGNNSSSSSTTSPAGSAEAAGQTSVKPRFDPTLSTLFTVEGLIYYLPEEAVRELFGAMLRVAAPGSRVAFDFLHKEVRG
jgi:hypothetical protein